MRLFTANLQIPDLLFSLLSNWSFIAGRYYDDTFPYRIIKLRESNLLQIGLTNKNLMLDFQYSEMELLGRISKSFPDSNIDRIKVKLF